LKLNYGYNCCFYW